MSKGVWFGMILVALLAGFGGGWAGNYVATNMTTGSTKTASPATVVTSASPTATTQSLSDCLTTVWGADKYAAITANANLATTEDNFAALKCYPTK